MQDMSGRSLKIRGVLLLALLGSMLLGGNLAMAEGANPLPPRYIAHAGGAVKQQTYTNSLEALDENYAKGFRFFEIDFSWTADGELVAIHDWEGALKGKFQVPQGMEVPTEKQFLKLEMKHELTQLSLKKVLSWANSKADAFIVTDIKDENTRALKKIAVDFGPFMDRIIPQVYSFKEYDEVSQLGYRDIILTLYRMKIDPYAVINFARTRTPFAITMPWKLAQGGLAYYLWRDRTVVYAHTVNDENIFASLRELGVYGIYTDFLVNQEP